MNFLMDGSNEDLNRVLKKPVVEDSDVESDGCPDEVIAGLSWEGYKKRNDSVVADVFAHGWSTGVELPSRLSAVHVRCNVCDLTCSHKADTVGAAI